MLSLLFPHCVSSQDRKITKTHIITDLACSPTILSKGHMHTLSKRDVHGVNVFSMYPTAGWGRGHTHTRYNIGESSLMAQVLVHTEEKETNIKADRDKLILVTLMVKWPQWSG